MDSEPANSDAWTAYGAHHLARGTDTPEVDRLAWGFWPTGPGTEILGNVSGHRVLDLCSGTGRYAAHLTREHGALVDAVDASATQHERARTRYGRRPGLNLILADAVEHLRTAEPYDVIYSIHGFAYIDPRRLLPAVAAALCPGGRLVFSVLHTDSDGHGPSATVTARPETLPLAGGGRLTVRMWVLTSELWEGLLAKHRLVVDRVVVLDAPEDDTPVSCRLFQVRHQTAGHQPHDHRGAGITTRTACDTNGPPCP
ncbi:class I SAM-dependent methyltransferase [Streptomyces sp. HK10]|uniref:class I SAM-dependent methyltransferase n=1 Tax=Streptomyces sp. HK10 TaxID=3373255 RepID=UPI00374A762F